MIENNHFLTRTFLLFPLFNFGSFFSKKHRPEYELAEIESSLIDIRDIQQQPPVLVDYVS